MCAVHTFYAQLHHPYNLLSSKMYDFTFNQSINQSIDQSINQLIMQPTDWSVSID